MKNNKLLNLAIFLSLFSCYIDIPKYGNEFFIQTIVNFFNLFFKDSFVTVLLCILIIGQLLVFIAPFTKKYFILSLIGISITTCFWVLILLLSFNTKSIISCIPYFVLTVILLFNFYKNGGQQ